MSALPAGWLFSPGSEILTTPGVYLLRGLDTLALLARHVRGDWGDLGDDDKAANDEALRQDGSCILSAYNTEQGRIWILTEAENEEGERWRTTLLLPEEY